MAAPSRRRWKGLVNGVLLAGAPFVLSILGGCASAVAVSAHPDRESNGVRTGWTAERCLGDAGAGDADRDGMDDGCEAALAAAFAPLLVVDPGECGWDASVAPGRLGGEYLYAARGQPDGRVRIAYLPAYYRDCGWRLPACRLTPWLCRPHPGDSEMMVVEVAPDAAGGRWRTERVFLSAHCHGRSAGRCRWYSGGELARFRWADGVRRGAPVVWVASGKHGNYPSPGACGAGHWGYDGCAGNTVSRRFPVVSPRQNAGSREVPFPYAGGRECIGADAVGWGSAIPDAGTVECFWSPHATFSGWQAGEGGGVTGYGRQLREAGF